MPLSLGLILTNLSAFFHLLVMSFILYVIAPIAFDVKIPGRPETYCELCRSFFCLGDKSFYFHTVYPNGSITIERLSSPDFFQQNAA